ncbi:hypothetical protein DOM22_10975 [Bdellovibrio sp. ZAP7]|uniref:hypothetical protein n=1 Tax=Bdellovibrio sp. ZAP7 TaxID=2231053 RepID=UPI0011592A68|nr:hypothetical protein [Bdellovibrio sp. ZAP7]QDK45634.1 hypothetical protein DOM22_10975 [Bdellovibrio sp. ZAP7]
MPVVPRINYDTKRLVAFLDVMGFQELLKDSTLASLQKYYDIANSFLVDKTNLYNSVAVDDNFQKIFVSDSIIMTVDLLSETEVDNEQENFERVRRLISAVGLLQYLLAIQANIWTRGAISIGDLFLEENTQTLVGPAFIQAYELEKKADYARVIIDPRVIAAFNISSMEFGDRLNSADTNSCHVIIPEFKQPFGLPQMQNDAVMIDWFRQSFDRTEPTENFFQDLKSRMLTKQELFEKGNKLIRYLVESYIVRTRTPLETNSITRAEVIQKQINQASGLNLPPMKYKGLATK